MGDYKYITAKNIKASGFDFSNITYVPEAVHRPIFERCNPEQGDVLYIKDGATTGIAIVNTLKEEFTLLSSVALLKQNRNVINGYFLAALLNNADMYSDIRNNMGGAAITRLTIAKLNAVKVIVPPLDLQNRFAAFVEQVDKSKFVKIGKNIFAFSIPVPHARAESNQISIEHYFTDEEIKTELEGKRLFIGNEFYKTGVCKSNPSLYYKSGARVADTIKIIEHESNNYVMNADGTGDYSISKSAFVNAICEEKDSFKGFSFDEFQKIFDVINSIVSSSKE